MYGLNKNKVLNKLVVEFQGEKINCHLNLKSGHFLSNLNLKSGHLICCNLEPKTEVQGYGSIT